MGSTMMPCQAFYFIYQICKKSRMAAYKAFFKYSSTLQGMGVTPFQAFFRSIQFAGGAKWWLTNLFVESPQFWRGCGMVVYQVLFFYKSFRGCGMVVYQAFFYESFRGCGMVVNQAFYLFINLLGGAEWWFTKHFFYKSFRGCRMVVYQPFLSIY